MSGKVKRLHESLQDERVEMWTRPFRLVNGIVRKAAGIDAVKAVHFRARRYVGGEEDLPGPEDLPGELAASWEAWRREAQHAIPPPPSVLLPIPRVEAEGWERARSVWKGEESVRLLLPLATLRAFNEDYGPAARVRRDHLAPSA